ncbi:MAG: type II toxin-antitoxin system HicB family antitoxin [Candidatus Latescibacteria bacterium]|nr:type II toxin-antitoxin system HicB family antitoxin [Candidatus Latescibacterota bacterium]
MKKTGLSEYITEALKQAVYDYCDQTQQWCAYIRELPGCWAAGETVEQVRQELKEVVEGWLILSLQAGDPIPHIKGYAIGSVAAHAATEAD